MKPFFVVSGLIMSLHISAQNRTLSGRITDNGHDPISGVEVRSKGNTAAKTDASGRFSIPCTDSSQVTFIYPGYETIQRSFATCDTGITVSMTPIAEQLDLVEVTASTESKNQALYQPMSMARLKEPELTRGTGLFLDDAVNQNVPGVFMQRRTISAGQQFNIRGYGNGARGTNGISSNFDGQGYKVYLNNIPITDAEGITLMDDIDFGSVGDVEVIKGPAGTLYGQAIAGVVNLKTARAPKNQVSIGQDVLAGSYGLFRSTTHLRIGGEQSSFHATYGKQEFGGFMPHTASFKDFMNLVYDVQPTRRQSVSAYIGYSNSYDERNGELTIGQYDTLDYSGNPNYIKNNAHSEVIGIRSGVSHRYRMTSTLENVTSVFGSGLNSNVSSAGGWTDKQPVNYGVRSTLEFRHHFTPKFALSGITGLELQRQDAQTIGYTMVTDSSNILGYNIIGALRSNQATISKSSTYFTEWTLHMPLDISVTAGIGVSMMDLRLNDRLYVPANNRPAKKTPSDFAASYSDMLSPHLAINKVISGSVSLYAAYSKGYKAPVSSYFYIPVTGEVNRNLLPEAGEQFEVGTKGRLWKNRLQYELAWFNTVFYQKLTAVAVPLNSLTTAYSYMVNGGKQLHTGVEAVLKCAIIEDSVGVIRLLRPFLNFAYADFRYGEFRFERLNSARTDVITADYSGMVVAGVPPVTVNAGFDFELPAGIYGNATWMYRDKMFFTSDNANETDVVSVVNAKVGIRRFIGRHWETDLFAGASNITGSQYYYMVFLNQLPDAYIPAPREINFFGGINLKYIF